MKEIKLKWIDFKANFVEKSFKKTDIQYFLRDNRYTVMIFDGPLLMQSSFDADSLDGIDFETNFKPTTNSRIAKTTNLTDLPMVAIYQSEGDFDSIVTHDLCDKTTWFNDSIRVTTETLILKSGTTDTYKSANTYWIDLTHGKHAKEYRINSNYLVNIYDNGVKITEDVDYSIDYIAGEIVIQPNYTVVGVITADYSYATTSNFVLKPNPGEIFRINHVELDFAANLKMSPVEFQIWVYNPGFNPSLPESQTNPLKVLADKILYNNEKDILKVGNNITKIAPWGALTNSVIRCEFDYGKPLDLVSSMGLELRLRILDDMPFIGEWSSATFYVTKESE